MNKIQRIKELIHKLHEASYAYYQNDNAIMSDKQYDDLFDELTSLENETGIIMGDSPTQKVQGFLLDGLSKVKHSRPMLSASKTKDINEVKKFMGDKTCVLSWKEDGLTIVLRYKDGVLDKAITRGSEGIIGEDVTHTMKMCKNIPIKLPFEIDLEVRGECVISWDEFNRINEGLEQPYKHPRNLAAGTVRQLDSDIARNRNIAFKAFELVQDSIYEKLHLNPKLSDLLMDIDESFTYLESCGFDVVEHETVSAETVEYVINKFNPEEYQYPVDGLIIRINDYLYGKSLGKTSHHTQDMIALKWEDELYSTILREVEWNTSRTGLVNPVAVFNPVNLDGAITTRATLHNISYIEALQLGIGDEIQVYRANMVIPKVHENLTRSNTLEIPGKCPCCGMPTEIKDNNGSKALCCTNPDCDAKILNKLIHFCSKKCLDIEGLSEVTLEKFYNLGWIKDYVDIFHLKDHYNEMVHLDGFGKRSADKLMASIEKARHCTFDKFLCSLGIPLIGRTASKQIAKLITGIYWDRADQYGGWNPTGSMGMFCCMKDEVQSAFDWTSLNDFGEAMADSLQKYMNDHMEMIELLAKEFDLDIEEPRTNNVTEITDMVFVITGSLNHFTNRYELKEKLESMGAKVSGSVSAKTSFLINNDVASMSGKNKKAKELGVSIISEEDLIKMIGD